LNRPVPNGMPVGVGGWGREASAYPIPTKSTLLLNSCAE